MHRRVVPLSPAGPAAPDVLSAPRLERFLEGQTTAQGVFQDFTGKVRRRFSVALNGVREGNIVTVTEDFLFDDGERERRIWTIEAVGENGYRAVAQDMIGAAEGGVRDERLCWSYLFQLKLGQRSVRVRFHETFVALAPDTILNAARVTKFGFEIGRTTILFRKGA